MKCTAQHLHQRREAGKIGKAPATARLIHFRTFEKPELLTPHCRSCRPQWRARSSERLFAEHVQTSIQCQHPLAAFIPSALIAASVNIKITDEHRTMDKWQGCGMVGKRDGQQSLHFRRGESAVRHAICAWGHSVPPESSKVTVRLMGEPQSAPLVW